MAFTPCSRHGGMYRGGANTVFLRLADGATQYGGRQQLCQPCVQDLLAYLGEHLAHVSEGDRFLDEPQSDHCLNCGGETDRPFKLYATAYPRGQLESQWYGEVCFECAAAVAEDLHLNPVLSAFAP